MAVIGAQRRTDNVAASQRVIDLHKKILLLEPDSAPIITILKSIYQGGMREAAEDSLFKWHNDRLENRWDAINNGAGYASTITSLVVDNGERFAVEDLVRVPRTGELLFVTGVSTNTLTVTRGAGTVAAAALVDDDPLFVIGTAAEEGDISLAPRSENPTLVTNYTQIFKQSIAASGTWLSSSNESNPHDWPHQVKKQMIEHLKDIEAMCLFGQPKEFTGPDGGKTRESGGLLYFLTSNNSSAGGTLDASEFDTWIGTMTRYGSKTKTVFTSRLVATVLNNHAAGKLNTFVGADTYGVSIGKWQNALGTVNLVTHNMLEGAVWGGYAVGVDFKTQEIAYKYLNGNGPGESRDTHVLPNRQENDRDGRKDEILTECGLQVALPEAGGLLTGVTG
jgi:Family of unknown function (DUF5309)